MATITVGTIPNQARARPWRRLVRRLPLLAAVTLGVRGVYALVIEPWHVNWGATPAEIQRTLPGDELMPDAGYVSTRAITINAPPEAIWP
jgi:hypothetical protein